MCRPGTVDDMDGQSSPISAHFATLQGLDLLPPPQGCDMDRLLPPCRSVFASQSQPSFLRALTSSLLPETLPSSSNGVIVSFYPGMDV